MIANCSIVIAENQNFLCRIVRSFPFIVLNRLTFLPPTHAVFPATHGGQLREGRIGGLSADRRSCSDGGGDPNIKEWGHSSQTPTTI
jgi:hypothetical protein